MTDKEEIIKYLNLQEKNIGFYKEEITRLEGVLKTLQTLDIKWIDPPTLDLSKESYSKGEVVEAFIKAKTYEGLVTNEFTTVLDTFIQFLDKKHHSLKSISTLTSKAF